MAKILVVDDEQQVRDMLIEMLSTSNYEVLAASHSEEAVEMQRATPCDLVIADVYMPGPDGVETIKEMLATNPELKIIALSGGGGFGQFDGLQRAVDAGASVAMKKPVDMEELLMTVNELL